MAESNFRGQPEDYLNWFSLDYVDKNRIVLPSPVSMFKTHSSSSAVQSTCNKYKNDKSYADEYIRQHNLEYKKSLEEVPVSCVENYQRHDALDDISTIVESESGVDVVDSRGRAEINEESFKTQVYFQFDFTKYNEESLKLPVYDCKKEILKRIEGYSVVVIQGATGCGKSTQVPQYILDDAVENNRHANILVTQPRKIAATSLANRVCQERGWDVGRLVAYQIGLDNRSSEHTRLLYCTTEVFVQKVIGKRSLDEFTHIILDEIHERDQHTDFALLIVKKLLHTVSRNVKIILMSATIDCVKFARYFATPSMGNLFPAPIISITDKTVHRVHMFYLENLKDAYPGPEIPSYSMDKPKIGPEMLQLAVNLINLFDDLERHEEEIKKVYLPNYRGAVLVFVPGIYEIENVIELLKKDAKRKKWELFPLHSTITLEEQKASFRASQLEVRKIIISTNIAESSITVPDIKYVIDFCLTKVVACDPITNYTSLKMSWASKSSCEQRAGRVGRVSSGRVYRLVEKEFYSELQSHPTAEICRSPLSSVILKIKQLDMGPPRALLALALDPPDLSDIYRTVLVLKQIGALTLKCDGVISSTDGDLTFLGRVAAALPLDPKLSKLIIMGYLFGCMEEAIIIAAGLSLKSFYSNPFQDELNAFVSKVYWAHESFCDCLAIFNTYSCWENFQMSGKFDRRKSAEKTWADEGYIQIECLKEVEKLVNELKLRLHRLELLIDSPQYCTEGYKWNEVRTFLLKICLAGAFFPNYFTKVIPNQYEKNICRELNGNDPFSTLVVSGLPAEFNILYDKQLRAVFRDCSKNLAINYDGVRAFIQFPKRRRILEMDDSEKDIPGQFPTAMHLALKMKQIPRKRRDLKLNLINSEVAREQMATISSQDSQSASQIAKREMKMLELDPPVLPHPSVNEIEVRVTNVESPSRIWVVADGSHYIENESFIERIIQMNIANKSLGPVEKVCPNKMCLGPYREDPAMEISYFRARIEEVNEQKGRALIYFVDFGNSEVVDIQSLREMPLDLKSIPMLAIEASLSEIKPSFILNAPNEDIKWSERSVLWLRENILDGEFFAQIYSVVNNVMHLELYDKVNFKYCASQCLSVNKMMIKHGMARRAEEFYLSKQNHELRSVIRSSRCSNNSNIQSATNSMRNVSLGSNFIGQFIPAGATSSIQANLRGPYSPLEMTFVPITNVGAKKSVRIESKSVNSTALDLEPQNYCDRLVVSPFVVLNSSENSVVLRHSTLLPVVPGMLGLCLLMFSPYVELRVSEDGSLYTGALCGLGPHPETGEPIYEEDDIEVAFDFRITKEEIERVNFLRYLMSSTLIEFNDQPTYEINEARASLKEAVLRIFDHERSYTEPILYHQSYLWNQVPSPLIKDQSEGMKLEESGSFLWKLINEISLQPPDKKKAIKEKILHLQRLLQDVKAERRPNSEFIHESCLLCNTIIKTVGDLKFHLGLKSHAIKVNRFHGFR